MAFSTDTTLPVCRKCKWCLEPKNDQSRCTHPKIPLEKDLEMSLITGTIYPGKYRTCDSAREDLGVFDDFARLFYYGHINCGVKAKYWEAKE